MSIRVRNEKCHFCSKSVYAMDKQQADNIVFHKGCMKCEHCGSTLSLGNFAGLNGKYYCKPHFKQLFQTKGNYSDGFGEEKPTSKWEATGQVFASATPGADFTKPKTSSPLTGANKPAKAESAPVKDEPAPTPAPAPAEPEPKPTPAPAPVEPEPEPEPVQEAPVPEPEPVQEAPAPEPEPTPAEPEPTPEPEPEPAVSEPEPDPEPEPEPAPSLSERMSSFTVDEAPKAPTPAAKAPASPATSSPGTVSVKKDGCLVCGKTVYPMEKMVADGKVFHKGCMKCTHCQKVLGLGNFAALNGKYYCKPHFKQLFATKGNYSDGFGEEAPTAKWEPQAPGYATGGPKKFF